MTQVEIPSWAQTSGALVAGGKPRKSPRVYACGRDYRIGSSPLTDWQTGSTLSSLRRFRPQLQALPFLLNSPFARAPPGAAHFVHKIERR
jgi:hypothetical protein